MRAIRCEPIPGTPTTQSAEKWSQLRRARWRRRALSQSSAAAPSAAIPQPRDTRVANHSNGPRREPDDAVMVREMRAARVLIALSACSLLVAASEGTAAGEPSWTSAELLVSPVRSEYPHLDITLSFANERGDPGRITLYTPRGAALYAQRP